MTKAELLSLRVLFLAFLVLYCDYPRRLCLLRASRIPSKGVALAEMRGKVQAVLDFTGKDFNSCCISALLLSRGEVGVEVKLLRTLYFVLNNYYQA